MAVADNRGSLGDACAADKSQHFGSNGSSKQHDVEQMPDRLVDAFVHKPWRMGPEDWRLADEPHGVIVSDLPVANVCASSAAATIVGCRLDVVERGDKSGADSCSLEYPGPPATGFGLKLIIVSVTVAAAARVSLRFPSRNKKFGATTELRWSCLRWVCAAVSASAMLLLAALA